MSETRKIAMRPTSTLVQMRGEPGVYKELRGRGVIGPKEAKGATHKPNGRELPYGFPPIKKATAK